MKKLMIAAGAFAFAAVTQAATVNWGGAISEPDGETAVAANTMAYLVFSDTAFSGAGATFDGTALKSGDTTLATMVDSHLITGDEADAWMFGGAYGNPGSDVNGFYAVLVSDNGAQPKYSFYALDEVTGTTAASQPTDRVLQWDAGYLTQDGYTVESVPEPTSGLLLLLGVAGLALRRRRA